MKPTASVLLVLCVAGAWLGPAPIGCCDEADASADVLVRRWCGSSEAERPTIERRIRALGASAVRALTRAADQPKTPRAHARVLRRIARELLEAWHRAECPDGMVYVPEGPLERPRDEQPWGPSGDRDTVGAFYIDALEVTVAAWRTWLTERAEGLGDAPLRRRPHEPEAGLPGNLPVTQISWEEAREFSAARGGRLPTAEEFERTLRGSGVATWPWGANDPAGRANLSGQGPERIVPVGSYPAAQSPFGALDLVGNVAEWSATTIPGGRSPLSRRPLVLGGSYRQRPDPALTWRGVRPRGDTTARHDWVGFRVAKDVPGALPDAKR